MCKQAEVTSEEEVRQQNPNSIELHEHKYCTGNTKRLRLYVTSHRTSSSGEADQSGYGSWLKMYCKCWAFGLVQKQWKLCSELMNIVNK